MSNSSVAELQRSPAQFFFELGYIACWAEAYLQAGGTGPFPISDAFIERAWEVGGEAHDDAEEFAAYLAAANGGTHRLQQLRDALEPFARYALAILQRREPDAAESQLVFGMDGRNVSIGDLRRACDACGLTQ